MYADSLIENNDCDQSIITGLGCNPNLIDNDGILDITAPQATSTVGNKKTRKDLARQYLNTLEEASERESDGLQQIKIAGTVGTTMMTSDLLNVHPQKAVDGKLTATERQSSSSHEELSKTRESSDLWRMMDVPLIRVERLSDLSSSRFLVDHTNLSTGELTRAPSEWGHLSPHEAREPVTTGMLNVKGTSPAVIQTDFITDFLDRDDSDLSEGEIEDFIPAGLDGKYLEQSVEVVRSHDEEPSYAHSTLLQASRLIGWQTSATASEVEGRVGGLPSALLQPQHSLLETQHARRGSSFNWDNSNLQSVTYGGFNEESFVNSKVQFDVRQISANSTALRSGLEESKLLSTSCNSLGSIGTDVKDANENDVHNESSEEAHYEWFQDHQNDLASILDGESFHDPNLDFFEEEEKETHKEYKFLEAENYNDKLDYSCFSGIYGQAEITVRPSWISSTEQNLVGPGNKMRIDDYLKSRSEALGSLENTKNGERPCFGTAVHSPPMAGNPVQLVDVSAEDSSVSQFCPQPDADEEQKTMTVDSNDTQRLSESSDSDSCCAPELDDGSPEEALPPNSQKKNNLSAPSSVKLGHPKDISKVANIKPSKDLMGSYLSEPLFKVPEKPAQEKDNVGKLPLSEKSQNFEETLNNINDFPSAEMISSLMSDALASQNPQELIDRIIMMTQQKSAMHKTLDETDLDMSKDVLELRRQREAMQSKPQAKTVQKADGASLGKENIGKEITQKLGKNLDKKASQLPPSGSTLKPSVGVSHKHMERLKVSKGNSAPGEATQSLKTNFNSNYASENTTIDESIQMARYKSTILEETHKLHLPSFHDDNSNGIDSSTPCVAWTKSRSKISPSSSLRSRSEGETVVENYRLGTDLINPRTSSESSAKGPVALSQNKDAPQFSLGPLRTTVKKSSLGIQEPSSSHTSESVAISVPSATSRRDLPPNTVAATAVRSTSFPAGLQSIGMAGGTPVTLTQATNYNQETRKYHSQENVTQQTAAGELNLPQRVVFPNVCVIGIASDVRISFHNPSPRWVQVSLKLVQETIDSCPTTVSALLFKPSYFVEPRNRCEIKLGVCSQFKGLLEAIFEVRVSDLAKGSGTYAAASQISLHTIIVSANINEPNVELTCDGEDELDFGVVPEGCNVSKKVTLINHSPQPLPVILHLQQVAVTSPIFFWDARKIDFAKVISSTRLSLELPAAGAESGPVPQTMDVSLKAPHLDNVKVGEAGVVGVRSQIQVELDTPNHSTIIIASFPVKAHIGAVRLQSLRTAESFTLETMSNETCTTTLALKNSSTFALRISLKSKEYEDIFKVHPNNIVIQAHSQAAPELVFAPRGQAGKMKSVVLMRVEPEGMEFELPIVGISNALPSPAVVPEKLSVAGVRENLPKSNHSSVAVAKSSGATMVVTKSNSVPLSQVAEKDLATALESTKSRLVFGTVSIGETSSRKLVMRNNCTTQALTLTFGFIGNRSYKVGEFGSKEGRSRMEVILNPCQELALSVFMCPTEVAPLSATLLCKYYGGTGNILKCKIPLQGYGGTSELEIPDACDGKPLILQDLAPGVPSLLKTAFINKGDRNMFIKLQVFTDDQCSELMASREISIQPPEFILAPKESRGVFIYANGTANILAKTPGCLGVLEVISGDEILRRRFRRLKNKEVKIRRVNDPTLLKIHWDTDYTGKKELNDEDDCLPPQPEDSTIFFNSCSKTQIQLYGESREREEASSTVFACLDADDTLSSVADMTVTHSRLMEVDGQTVRGCTIPPAPKSSTVLQATANTEAGKNFSWDVFPQTLSVVASDVSTNVFFVVNLSNVQQMFEATSNCRWLDIDPREAILPCQSSVKVLVKIIPSLMPQPLTKPVTQTLKIMCENESRCASITVLPAEDDGSSDTQPVTVAAQHGSALRTLPSRVPFPDKMKYIDLQATELRMPAIKYPSTSATNSERTRASSNVTSTVGSQGSERDLRHMDNTESLVQVVSDTITFPDTPVMRENHMKVKLRNLDGVLHVVTAGVIKGPFAVRHTQFNIKPDHYVSVPVYFRPQKMGMFSGQLKLVVLEEQKAISVQLYGRAV
ncbi:uncharacterized protein [Procambarus clarkii]|uniref:uncharacterized protein isoform X2 n=1 Tax=Procambarus clarkii TaxID=6728 RepID=UPI003743F6A3